MQNTESKYTPSYPEDFNVPDQDPKERDTSLLSKTAKVVLAGLSAVVAAELVSFRKGKKK